MMCVVSSLIALGLVTGQLAPVHLNSTSVSWIRMATGSLTTSTVQVCKRQCHAIFFTHLTNLCPHDYTDFHPKIICKLDSFSQRCSTYTRIRGINKRTNRFYPVFSCLPIVYSGGTVYNFYLYSEGEFFKNQILNRTAIHS
jgi:hypothetical protein